MPSEQPNWIGYILMTSFLPWTFTPLALSIAFLRLWLKFRHWSLAMLSISSLIGFLSVLAHSLAINIPKMGKTESEVGKIKDIPWLFNSSIVLSTISSWGALLGAIVLIGSVYKLYSQSENL